MLKFCKFVAISFGILLFLESYSDALSRPSSLTRAGCPTIRLKNGRSRYRQKSGFVQNICNKGYLLAGDKYMKCTNSGWEGTMPTCVRNSCKAIHDPLNGFVFPSHRGGVLNFYCKPGYELIGPATAFCDGTSWSTHLPICKASDKIVSITCDFEEAEICGWTHDLNHNFDWTRHNQGTPSTFAGTGPSHDHTFGSGKAGYYMYIEASSKNPSDTARLISPAHTSQENNTCLEFWYHMYGTTMGQLRVYLNRMSNGDWNFHPDQALFTVSGNHGNRWLKGFVELGPIDDDFQVIFEAVRGGNYMSDTAIDDVKLIENCVVPEAEPTEETTSIDFSTTDNAWLYFSNWTCQNRCGMVASMFCSCSLECYEKEDCCPDYEAYCLELDLETPGVDVTSTSSMDDTTEQLPTTITQHFINKVKLPITTTESENITEKVLISTTDTTTSTVKTTTTTTKVPKLESVTIQTPIVPPKKINPKVNITLPTTTTTKKKITPTPTTTTTTTTTTTIKPKETTTRRAKSTIAIIATKPKKIKINDDNKQNEVLIKQNGIKQEIKENNMNDNDLTISLGNKDKLSNEQAGISTSLIIISTAVATLIVGVVVLIKLRRRCNCPVRMRRGQSSDSQSDVRFLTSDEILDFSLASSTL